MDIILYNPLSNRGKNKQVAQKLQRKLLKKKEIVQIEDLLHITDVKAFLSNLSSDDRIIIVGGDGTIHRIVNQVDFKDVLPDIYMYKAGSGNDFLRSLPHRGKLVPIKQYLHEFPTLTTKSGSIKVINGAGVGLDGMVCRRVNISKALKNKSNYMRNSIISFFKFKPVAATFKVDGKQYREKKVWFASSMYAKYFGGGMKIGVNKKRNDGMLRLVIVKNVPKFILLLIFPTIYFGWHKIFRCYVSFYDGKEIEVSISKPNYLQADGETDDVVTHYKMNI